MVMVLDSCKLLAVAVDLAIAEVHTEWELVVEGK